MYGCRRHTVGVVALLLIVSFATAWAVAVEAPRYGGVLTFVVSAEPPSFDAHRETTFAVIHPLAPFYSTLIRVNPENPADPTDFVGDVALAVPAPTDSGTIYTFTLRRNVRFRDGQPLTARDVVATYNKIIFPPPGVRSARKGFFSMVETVTATDDYTVVFKLNYPSSAFIPAVANPYNFLYSASRLAQDMHWYETHIMGSGPFIYKGHNPGGFIEGKRNPNYHHAGKPYLDGFRAMFVKQQAQRVRAIRDGQALIEFRGFPPKVRDDLRRQLRHQITVQESDWNCALLATPNHGVKPFDDPRVRRALSLAIDRWGGSPLMARAAIVKTVGGIVFPGHPLAASQTELQQLAGYWPDLDRSRAEARRLLCEAGVPGGFRFHVRGVDQPYKIVGSWLAGQWRRIGLDSDLVVQPTGPFFDTLRQGTFDVSIDPNCQSVVNPLLDVRKKLSALGQKSGFEVVDLRSPPALDVLQKNLQALADGDIRVDAVYLPLDSFMISQAKLIGTVLRDAKVKSIGSMDTFVKNGVLRGLSPTITNSVKALQLSLMRIKKVEAYKRYQSSRSNSLC